MHKILLVISVISVAFRNVGSYFVKSSLYCVVYISYRNNAVGVEFSQMSNGQINNMTAFLFRKVVHCSACRLFDCRNNLLSLERLKGTVFFLNCQHTNTSYFSISRRFSK